ncbi:MAG TPA: choice-of-anchor Q domain-containing protein, partial [Bacteroidales bacterium]|nr:choice-of-anchor Q domain-containing protein [Bacteroidales bacterium]
MNVAGLYGAGAHIEAENSVFADCGQYTAALLYGGLYDFRHCTFANYYTGSRQNSSVVLNNYFAYENNQGTIVDARPFDAYFGNCIIHGNLEEEINIDGVAEAGFEYSFSHCLLKTEQNTGNEHFNAVIVNEDPQFVDKYEMYDFHLDTLSPAINAGDPGIATSVPLDFDGNSRLSDDAPDLGAFERMN